jgi:hypothetical protein
MRAHRRQGKQCSSEIVERTTAAMAAAYDFGMLPGAGFAGAGGAEDPLAGAVVCAPGVASAVLFQAVPGAPLDDVDVQVVPGAVGGANDERGRLGRDDAHPLGAAVVGEGRGCAAPA